MFGEYNSFVIAAILYSLSTISYFIFLSLEWKN